jgi:DNA-binding XRE family transcriptional regulator
MIKSKTELIKRVRILEGYTQNEASKKVNLNPASYCLIENGKLGVKPKTAKVICALYNKQFDELFEIIN